MKIGHSYKTNVNPNLHTDKECYSLVPGYNPYSSSPIVFLVVDSFTTKVGIANNFYNSYKVLTSRAVGWILLHAPEDDFLDTKGEVMFRNSSLYIKEVLTEEDLEFKLPSYR